MADVDPRDWSLIERFMVPREPKKPNDLVVLGILGMTCGIVMLSSLALIYQRFGA
jgi:cytoskeletal protein RodZ